MNGEDFEPDWAFQDFGNFFRMRSGRKYLTSRFADAHFLKERCLFNVRNRVAFANDRNSGLVIEIAEIAYEHSNEEFAKNRRLSESLHNTSADSGRKRHRDKRDQNRRNGIGVRP